MFRTRLTSRPYASATDDPPAQGCGACDFADRQDLDERFHAARALHGRSAQQQVRSKEQAKWWSDRANLTFIFDNAPDADIRITFDENDGAWGYIGTDAKGIPTNEATMNLRFLDGGAAAHEFGHAIGLAHEHQNPAGGIKWNEAVVIRELAGSPNFWTEVQTCHNVLRKYSADQINGTAFDPDSVLVFLPQRMDA